LNLTAFLASLISLTLIYTSTDTILASHHVSLSEESELLWRFLSSFFIACWVHLDRRTQKLNWPFEFDAFVFFAWPVALPYYLLKSRGMRGLLLAALIFALMLVPRAIQIVIRMT
jgi:hypothetical protein